MSWPNEDRLGTPADVAEYMAEYNKAGKPNVRLIEEWCRRRLIGGAFKPPGSKRWKFDPNTFKAWIAEQAREGQS